MMKFSPSFSRFTNMTAVLFACGTLIASNAQARTGVFQFSGGVMALTNSSTVSGQGPSGTSVLSQWELAISHKWLSGGLFFQYDRQGSNQTDTMFGPKLEAVWKAFFAEFGFGFIMNRAFTDRSIATQTGNGLYYGFGVQFPLSGGGGSGGGGRSKGLFFRASYKFRTQNVLQQDNVELPYTVRQWDGYPLFGLGYAF